MSELTQRAGFVIEDNPYEVLYIDLTSRCNMVCNFCYNSSAGSGEDMDINYFEEVCQRLPRPVFMRFVGGEPALHPRFFDFIKIVRKYRHHVHFSSNGLVYNDDDFVRNLKSLNGQAAASMTMDGGCTGRNIYQEINGGDYLEQKLQAFENLIRFDIKRVGLSALIARGVNEQIVPELLDLAERHKRNVRYIHFRTAAKVGRWVDTIPYSLEELKSLVGMHFSAEAFSPRCLNEIHCRPDENRNCCYRFRPTNRLQISLIEFASDRSVECPKRGKLMDDFRVLPFFKQMISPDQYNDTGSIRPDAEIQSVQN